MPQNLSMKHLLLFSFLLGSASIFAQRPIESSADIYQEIKRLNVLTNVLYLAAHPDDENTRLIAWLENEKLARTAYLSLTRGSGGQNLIGTEKGPAMGVLRTQELIEARKIDGGEQFFTSAYDFGYSKTADETLEIWNKEEVLEDVVWTIRKFRPDVIITRFPPDKRAGHGHHTASAMLAEEAFVLSADASAYPDHMGYLRAYNHGMKPVPKEVIKSPWQAKRLLWNTSVWWDRQLPEKAAKEDDYIKIDIGEYNKLLGLSYSEIASDSRSQHQSQGFGSARARGSQIEYIKHTLGEQAEKDLFEGINTTWERVEGSEQIQKLVNNLIENYDFKDPSQSLDLLLKLHALLEERVAVDGAMNSYNPAEKESDFYIEQKLSDVKRLIKAVAGIHAELLADKYYYTADKTIEINLKLNLIVRNSEKDIVLKRLQTSGGNRTINESLSANSMFTKEYIDTLKSMDESIISNTHPYWLKDYKKAGTKMLDPAQKGLDENLPISEVRYELQFGNETVTFSEPIDYKWVDRADGELHRDVEIYPSATATPSEKVYLISDQTSLPIEVLVEAHTNNFSTSLVPSIPEGWSIRPQKIDVALENAGDQRSFSFQLSPPAENSIGEIQFMWGDEKAHAFQLIDYPHIKPQVMFPSSTAKIVKTEVKRSVDQILYIEGSGDEVAENLSQIGYEVTSINPEELAITDLAPYQTIIVGIRAYNTSESMKSGNALLNEFAENGGNVIVQYNTSRGIKSDQIGPYKLQLSRKRVTKEDSEVNFLKSDHAILNTPNEITQDDFNYWVQERGLYFADDWDQEKYTPILSWNDPGEEPQEGGLLVADYGEGHFIYTGISFFRQLPAGVPGAYRLMSNLISYGRE